VHRAAQQLSKSNDASLTFADVERDAFRQGAANLGVPSNTWAIP